MYDHTLNCGRKKFCCYCLQVFSSEEILKSHIKDCLKINGKQRIIMSKKGEYVKSKNYEKKIVQILKAFWRNKIMKSKIQMILIQRNIKNILLAVMDIK